MTFLRNRFKCIDRTDKIALIIILIFFFLELINIRLPGLFDDEALPGSGSLQILKNTNPSFFSLKLFNINFPLMIVNYETAIESYILLPFLLIFGINVFALRFAAISISGIALFVLYIFLREFFDKRVALFSLGFATINSIFLLDTKIGLDSASMLQFFSAGALFCLWRWHNKKGDKYFYMCALLLGLGLSVRVWLLWFINALGLLALFFSKTIKPLFKGKILKYTLFLGLFFCFGILLFLIYNFTTKFDTFRYVLDNFMESKNGVNNFNYLGNLLMRLKDLRLWLTGEHVLYRQGAWNGYTPVGDICRSLASFWFFILSYLFLMCSAFFRKSYFSRKKIFFILFLFVLILLQSPFTLSSLGGPHLFILYPLVQVIYGLAVVEAWILVRESKAMLLVGIAILSFFITSEINVTIRNNYLYFYRTGGTGNNSDAIYSLVRYFKDSHIKSPVLMDWGLFHNIVFLSKGEVFPRCSRFIHDGFRKEYFLNDIRNALRQSSVYVFHSPKYTNRPEVMTSFKEVCAEFGVRPQPIKFFYQKNNELLYVIYGVQSL